MKTKYVILSEPSAAQLEERVNAMLRLGWDLYGDLLFCIGDQYFYQAMTRSI